MRLRSSPAGVKVSTLPGKPEVSGSIPEFFLYLCCIYLVFTFVFRLLSACTLNRGVPSRPRALSQPNLNRTNPSSILHLNDTSLCLPMYLL